MSQCVFTVLENGLVEKSGGHSRWLKHNDVGSDGFTLNWREQAASLLAPFNVNSSGMLVWRRSDRVVTLEQGSLLPPGLRLLVRARHVLNANEDLPIHNGRRIKRKDTHVNLHECNAMLGNVTRWQARIRATHFVTIDATGAGEGRAGARVACFDNEDVFGGILDEPEGGDNYIGELAGQIDAFAQLDEHSRVVVVFDATSPIRSMMAFRRLGARSRQDKHLSRLIETLEALVRRVEVAVFLWQPSHCGEPINELADVLAAQASEEEGPPVPIMRLPCLFTSVTFHKTHASQGEDLQIEYKWSDATVRADCARVAGGVVMERLLSTVESTIMFDDATHLPVAKLDDKLELTRRALLGLRCYPADSGQRLGRWAAKALRGFPCPHGCQGGDGQPAVLDWEHVTYHCTRSRLNSLRKDAVLSAEVLLAKIARKGKLTACATYGQVTRFCWRAKCSLAGWDSSTFLTRRVVDSLPRGRPPKTIATSERELAGGLTLRTGHAGSDRDRGIIRAAHALTGALLRLHDSALHDSRDARAEMRDATRALQLAHKWFTAWASLMKYSGARRRAALAEIRMERRDACKCLRAMRVTGNMDSGQLKRRLDTVISSSAFLIDNAVVAFRENRVADARPWLKAHIFYSWVAMRQRYHIRTRLREATQVRELLHGDATHAAVGLEVVPVDTDWEIRCKRLHALRQWWWLGGWGALRARAKLVAAAKAARLENLQRRAMANYLATGTLSGAAVQDVGSHVMLDCTRAGAQGRKRRKLSQRAKLTAGVRAKRSRAEAEAELRERAIGEGDSLQRYPVLGYSDLRRLPGRGRRIIALVQWEGEEYEGQDSWQPLRNLTTDMRRQAEAEARIKWPVGQRSISAGVRRRMVRTQLSRRGRLTACGAFTADSRLADSSEDEDDVGAVRAVRVLEDEEVGRRRKRRAGAIGLDAGDDA